MSLPPITSPVSILSLCVAVFTFFPGPAPAAPVSESEPNDSPATAQPVDAFFDLTFDDNIENASGDNLSTQIHHVEVISEGDAPITKDFYSVTVGGISTVTIDIDCGTGDSPSCPFLVGHDDVDTFIVLYDPSGAIFAFNDDPPVLPVDTGSSSELDSFLRISLPSAGTWTVEVGKYPGLPGDPPALPIPADSDYLLNISVFPGGSNCCDIHSTAGCEDLTCEATVCAGDAFCCTEEWDDQCVGEAESLCGCHLPMPEPGQWLQLVSGLLGLIVLNKRRRMT
jgi:hypothetical protein